MSCTESNTTVPVSAHKLIMLCQSVKKQILAYRELCDRRYMIDFKDRYREKKAKSIVEKLRIIFGFQPTPTPSEDDFIHMAIIDGTSDMEGCPIYRAYPTDHYRTELVLANTLEKAAEFSSMNVRVGAQPPTIMIVADQLSSLLYAQDALKKIDFASLEGELQDDTK